ncbi:MAG: hypothetical protein FJY16_01845 [Bacteroidetes bacterium]|nr:hypothetical protein [Bacteroidota bacterium]
MKFFLSVLLTLLGGIGISLWAQSPWWGFVPVAFILAVAIHQAPPKAFAAGFLGMLLAWGGLSWWIDWQNTSLLSKQVAVLFPLQGSSAALILLTGILGGLLGGIAALAGCYLRSAKSKVE